MLIECEVPHHSFVRASSFTDLLSLILLGCSLPSPQVNPVAPCSFSLLMLSLATDGIYHHKLLSKRVARLLMTSYGLIHACYSLWYL